MSRSRELPPIPTEQALHLRRLLHDLSNALEIILQTSYLLSTSNLEGPALQWHQLLDQGVKQATNLNRELREYVRSHSEDAAA
ncbi:MAG TPA: hypothetical protein VFA02_01500 [Pseudacidobacterium sp.]|nr:hypothetical protein [Pseudacidobacterium sp.]